LEKNINQNYIHHPAKAGFPLPFDLAQDRRYNRASRRGLRGVICLKTFKI